MTTESKIPVNALPAGRDNFSQEQLYIGEFIHNTTGLEVIKLEFILKHKIKRNDWLLADTCPQVANHCALFLSIFWQENPSEER